MTGQMASPAEKCPRGPWTALHAAARDGSSARVQRLVSTGSTAINQGSIKGFTPLMLAADAGHSRIVSILLGRGATMTAVGDDGVTALHVAARNGHVAVLIILVKAGADVGISCPHSGGYTPLHLAAHFGRCRVMELLVRAGAGVDDRLTHGSTAMYLAAEVGELGAVKVLLANKAQPNIETVDGYTPLDVAAEKCHVDIVRELIKHVGIGGCGGRSQGGLALRMAAVRGHLGVLDILHEAGARDHSGEALCAALIYGGEQSVISLLQQHSTVFGEFGAYANSACGVIGKPLLCCVTPPAIRMCSHRVVRRLVDAGADATFPFNRMDDDGNFLYQSPFSDMVTMLIDDKESGLSDNQVLGLHGVHRLLMQLAAVRAMSWGWIRPSGGVKGATAASSASPALLLPIRREAAAAKTRVVTRALLRYTRKMDEPFLDYAEPERENT